MGLQRLGIPKLTEEEKQQGLRALAEARRLRAESLARRNGEVFSDSAEGLRGLRDERTQQLESGNQDR